VVSILRTYLARWAPRRIRRVVPFSDDLILDNQCVGFFGPAQSCVVHEGQVIDGPAGEIRKVLLEWMRAGIGHLVDVTESLRQEPTFVYQCCEFWSVITWYLEPEFAEIAAPVFQVQGAEQVRLCALAELAAGLFFGARRWSSVSPAAKVVAPFLKELLLTKGDQTASVARMLVNSVIGDCDWRRARGLLDLADELLDDKDDGRFRSGVMILSMMVGQASPRFLPEIDSRFAAKILPRLLPQEGVTVPLLDGVGGLFSEVLFNSGTVIPCAWEAPKAIWTKVLESQFGQSHDQLARLLSKCDFQCAVGGILLPVIAPRLGKVWAVTSAVSASAEEGAHAFAAKLGTLEWSRDLDSLLIALNEAKASIEGGSWMVQQQAGYFLLGVVLSTRFVLREEHLGAIWQAAAAMSNSARAEVRDGAVNVLTAMVPLGGSAGEFFETNVKGREGAVGIAAGIALMPSVDVLSEIEPWVPALFEFLETAHGSFDAWSKAIESCFGTFWKAVGSREVPSLDGWRQVFVGGYFS
jgi:hypothetical protein